MIVVANKKRKLEKIMEENPGAYILDVTSSSEQYEGKVLSPFYTSFLTNKSSYSNYHCNTNSKACQSLLSR